MAAARKTDENDSDGAIHKMDTLPPPEGEDDAYNAATRIGPLARGIVQAMMEKSKADENGSSLPPPVSMTRDLSLPRPARVPTIELSDNEQVVQRMYDDVEEGDQLDPTGFVEVPVALSPARLPTPVETGPAVSEVNVATPSTRRTASTRNLELLIFFGTVLLLAIPATLAFLYWVN